MNNDRLICIKREKTFALDSGAKKAVDASVAERNGSARAIIGLDEDGEIVAGCTLCPGNACKHIASLLCYMNDRLSELDAVKTIKKIKYF